MLPYWLFFLVPAIAALMATPAWRFQKDDMPRVRLTGIWLLVFFILTIIMGFRFEVGGDWGNYLGYLQRAQTFSFSDLVDLSDPSYWALNIFSIRLGLGMVGVNILGGIIFSAGLVIFCCYLPRPWLALACAIPYLFIVVGMGYTRQGIALGMVMIAIVAMLKKRYFAFVVLILIGATFHKTAVLMLPIVGISISTNRYITVPLIAVATGLGYITLLEDSVNNLIYNYQDEKIQSSGALARLIMNALPAIFFILISKKIFMSAQERKLWKIFSTMSIGMTFVFFLAEISTALDRLALYLIPLQLVVFSHLPDAIGVPQKRNQVIVLAILVYYALVMFVWLNYATNANRWLPYQMGFS